MSVNGAAIDILFSNPRENICSQMTTALFSFNQLFMNEMLSKNGKHRHVRGTEIQYDQATVGKHKLRVRLCNFRLLEQMLNFCNF